MPTVEVFVDAGEEEEPSVGVILRDSSIVEWEGELVPCCRMTAQIARVMAKVLNQCADKIDAQPDCD